MKHIPHPDQNGYNQGSDKQYFDHLYHKKPELGLVVS